MDYQNPAFSWRGRPLLSFLDNDLRWILPSHQLPILYTLEHSNYIDEISLPELTRLLERMIDKARQSPNDPQVVRQLLVSAKEFSDISITDTRQTPLPPAKALVLLKALVDNFTYFQRLRSGDHMLRSVALDLAEPLNYDVVLLHEDWFEATDLSI